MKYINTSEAAQMIGVSPPTLRDYIRRGLLTCNRTIGGQARLKREDVESFCEQYELEPVRKPFPESLTANVAEGETIELTLNKSGLSYRAAWLLSDAVYRGATLPYKGTRICDVCPNETICDCGKAKDVK